jgi:hypothetical protein
MNDPQFTAADDRFHFESMSDRWWETETCWFSFFDPDRRLGGWMYTMVRPNIGTVSGGTWIWDGSGYLPWEVRYSANYATLRLPRDQDLTDIQLPTGVYIKALEPLTTYEFGHRDEPHLVADLRFEASIPPQALRSVGSAFGHATHFDQLGRVTGRLVLDGEPIEIDCYSMRDRTWGPRPEHRPRHTAYVTGATGPDHGFLGVTDSSNPADPITHGFYLRDGESSPIASGNRSVRRHAELGWVTEIEVRGKDALGREFHAVGRDLSHIIINRHSMIDSNSLIEWELDGVRGWGEDQDLWPMLAWSRQRRKGWA